MTSVQWAGRTREQFAAMQAINPEVCELLWDKVTFLVSRRRESFLLPSSPFERFEQLRDAGLLVPTNNRETPNEYRLYQQWRAGVGGLLVAIEIVGRRVLVTILDVFEITYLPYRRGNVIAQLQDIAPQWRTQANALLVAFRRAQSDAAVIEKEMECGRLIRNSYSGDGTHILFQHSDPGGLCLLVTVDPTQSMLTPVQLIGIDYGSVMPRRRIQS